MAVGDRVEKRLAGPVALGTSNGTIGTVPANRQWTTKQVVFTNTNGVEALVYFAVGTAATAANRIFSALPIASNDTVVFDTALVVDAAETFQGYADRAGVNVTVVGWEKEV
jgi:O-phosphoseryl-tRNA(Cys) synthetase